MPQTSDDFVDKPKNKEPRNIQTVTTSKHSTQKTSGGERPSIANPTERAMVNEEVEVIVV